MTYSVLKLINNAYYLSGFVSRRLQTVNAQQQSDGLDLLNDVLSEKNTDSRLIPYFRSESVTSVIGQEGYDVANLLYIETITFNIGNVRYQMIPEGRKAYFGSNRVNGVQSLQFKYHTERQKDGSRLFVYFVPNAAYPMTIWGKFGLAEVTSLSQDLSLTYDRFYINYLRYALGKYICDENGISFPQQAKIEELEAKLYDLSPIDLTTTKVSSMQGDNGLNWAYITFPGWAPS